MQRKTKKRPDTAALILLPQWAGFLRLHSLLRAFFLPAWVRYFLGFQGQGWLVSAPVELLRVGNTCKKSRGLSARGVTEGITTVLAAASWLLPQIRIF